MPTARPAPPILALHLLDEQTKPPIPKVGTGCPSIDRALKGGLSYGQITAIEGARGTGKTLIALHILTTHLLSSPTARAAIVDTRGIHSPPYFLRDIVQARLGGDVGKIEGVLDRVMVMRVFDVWGLCEGVEEVGRGLREKRVDSGTEKTLEIADSEGESSDSYDNIGADPPKSAPKLSSTLLLVDLLTPLFTTLMQTSQTTALSLLHTLLRTLHHLTASHSLCSILLNSAYPVPNSTNSINHPASIFSKLPAHRPALGRSFGFCVDTRVYLSKVPKGGDDAEDRVLGRDGGKVVGVVEVLGERSGGGEGRWGWWDCVVSPLNHLERHLLA
ncbi:MAG: hypothetical protein M1839_001361 [Geoglossum umbratile]|nr:MAG: hypothetical protein M1839_001361 [Geoglossum umbratile]